MIGSAVPSTAKVAAALAPWRPAPGALVPGDKHDDLLVERVRPSTWLNPTPSGRYNLVVVGAGTAGLVSAAGAAGLGAKVALVERGLMGGDCLVHGCVPSKGLLRAARAISDVREGPSFGARIEGRAVPDFGAAMDRMRRLRAELASADSASRFAGLGVDVHLGDARFVAHDAVDVGGTRLRFARAVIATGAGPAVPDLPGLAEAGFLTSETVFSLTGLPRRLVVIGEGPIGCELAQAFRRFGSDVTVIGQAERLLPREDRDASALLAARFAAEGIRSVLGAAIQSVGAEPAGKLVTLVAKGRRDAVAADAILVATGRRPNLDRLGLEAAGVSYGPAGVGVDDHLRTSNRRIYAAGDVCSRFKFTHAADAMARVVLANALFFGRRRASALVIPWCTYTDPEVAHVGASAEDAAANPKTRTLTVELREVDRAVLDGETEGFARVHVDGAGRILGGTIVARHAGEMIGELGLAMTAGLRVSMLGRTIHPYPTQASALKRIGDAFERSRLSPGLRGWLERFFRWRR